MKDRIDGLNSVGVDERRTTFNKGDVIVFLRYLTEGSDENTIMQTMVADDVYVPVGFSSLRKAYKFMSRFPNHFIDTIVREFVVTEDNFDIILADDLIAYFNEAGQLSCYSEKEYLALNNFPTAYEENYPMEIIKKGDGFVLRTAELHSSIDLQIDLDIYPYGMAAGILCIAQDQIRNGKEIAYIGAPIFYPDESNVFAIVSSVYKEKDTDKTVLAINIPNIAKKIMEEKDGKEE